MTAPNDLLDLTGNQREVTVFTHVNEKAQWDMSQLVLDLDTKEAEINILQSLLTQRESKLKACLIVLYCIVFIYL